MDTAQWPQEIVVKPIEEIVTSNNSSYPKQAAARSQAQAAILERKVGRGGQKEQASAAAAAAAALNCPRCNSTNTKFCYYNNYSLTQPRYFCKTCRRYWTEGGSLRNIPVGGGSRKNKRPSSSSSSSTSTPANLSSSISKKLDPPDLIIHSQPQDLNLSFQSTHQDFNNNPPPPPPPPPLTTTTSTAAAISSTSELSAMELLNGMTNSRGGFNYSFIPMSNIPDPNSVYPSGFAIQDHHHHHQFKLPSFNFCLDGVGDHHGYGNLQPGGDDHSRHQTQTGNSGRILLPFEDLKQISSSNNTNGNIGGGIIDHQQSKDQQQAAGADSTTGYWTGMLSGGSW